MTRLATRLLLALSRQPDAPDLVASEIPADGSDASLRQLLQSFPDLGELIAEKVVVDYGCGSGGQSLALARFGARRVLGIDIQPLLLEEARQKAASAGVANVAFLRPAEVSAESADIVVSQNSMEHFGDPVRELVNMRDLLAPSGSVLVTFCPTWYSPYGAHMHFFTRIPWVQILFSERTILDARRRFRADGAECFADVPGGLNQMSVRKFHRCVSAAGLRVARLRYGTVKNLPLVDRVPGVRELFINQIDALLQHR